MRICAEGDEIVLTEVITGIVWSECLRVSITGLVGNTR